jgi:hypothetical protein
LREKFEEVLNDSSVLLSCKNSSLSVKGKHDLLIDLTKKYAPHLVSDLKNVESFYHINHLEIHDSIEPEVFSLLRKMLSFLL